MADEQDKKEEKNEAVQENAQQAVEVKAEAGEEQVVDHKIRGILGRKVGMTQIFDKEGNVVPVTVVEAGPCTILELKSSPVKVKVGFEPIKEVKLKKPQLGYFKKLNVEPQKFTREFSSTDNSVYKVGMKIKANVFKPGDYVDVTGISIGKGFQGGMKRHGWMGGPGGHGSMHHRRIGSVGASSFPSKVVKGHPMPGHMGARMITTQGLRVMDVDVANNIILVKGSIPGHKRAVVSIKLSRKRAWKDLHAVKAVVKHKVNPMKQSKAKAGAKKK